MVFPSFLDRFPFLRPFANACLYNVSSKLCAKIARVAKDVFRGVSIEWLSLLLICKMVSPAEKDPPIFKKRNFTMIKSLFLFCSFACFGSPITLEEKVGQLLMVHFRGTEGNDDARRLVQGVKVGAIIYYNWANELSSPEQVAKLSRGLQQLAKETANGTPLLIAADQEGGIVSRLSQGGFTVFPGNWAVQEAGDLRLAQEAALCMGKEMLSVGVNMNLAPVIDVNSNPKNPVIGIRSFGDDPVTVTRYGREALKGYQRAGVATTLKHFPGHGDVKKDSHLDLSVVEKSLQAFQECDLAPFKALAKEADAVMTAHLLSPIDPSTCATFSEKVIRYLRREIGFDGVVITDSLIMGGVLKIAASVDQAAIRALNAGCDLLCLGGRLLEGENKDLELEVADVERIHRAIVDAVKEGIIPQKRIDEAVRRVLDLKSRALCRHSNGSFNRAQHQAVAEEIAKKAIRGPEIAFPPMPDKKVVFFAPPQVASLSLLAHPLDQLEAASEADWLIVFSYNAWKDPAQKEKIDALIKTGRPVVLVATRDPQDGELFPQVEWVYRTFSPTAVSIEALLKRLPSFSPIIGN